MAGWSILTNGSGSDSAENTGAHQGNGVLSGGGDSVEEEGGVTVDNGSDSDGHNVKVRRLFDKVLSVFLKAMGEKGVFRPIPAVVDYRKPVDLFKLFWVVREKGGYDSVSKKRLWALVAKESGLGVGASTAGVKLVYLKYLSELEQWLREKRFKDQTSGNGNFRLLSLELESEFRDLFSDRFDWEGKNGGLVQLECDKNGGGTGDYVRKLGLTNKKDLGLRFHIAEARMKLKLELLLVFYHWKFDRMGEEVSLQWTAEEEKRFKDIVRSSLHFGNRKVRRFPRKTRENLVSYYFNVFLVQKRSYQNRVTPIKVDSDDDESEFGMVGDRFGNNAVNVSGSNFLPCIQNKQCIDVE